MQPPEQKVPTSGTFAKKSSKAWNFSKPRRPESSNAWNFRQKKFQGLELFISACLLVFLTSQAHANDAPRPPVADPFSYRAADTGDFVTDPDARVPPGIRVQAILHTRDKPPHAVLRIPGMPNPVFVAPEDVIRIEPTTAQEDPVYLLVHSIDRHTVEISPRKRPSEIHVFH